MLFGGIMTFKHLIMAIILVFILLSGCAHQQTLSGEAAPPIETTTNSGAPGTTGTGGGTVLNESDW